jgi:iron-sulfur cluster repair protein YtfE (RIC family)
LLLPAAVNELLGSLAIRRPAAVAVFARLGFDLTLEHGRTLEEAAAMRDLDLHEVLASIADAEAPPSLAASLEDWSSLRAERPFFSTWQPGHYLPRS